MTADVLTVDDPRPVSVPYARGDGRAEVAGLAVIAADTDRVLLVQRALDDNDPAGGTFEFPGGHLDDGESPLDAAVREWQEETGLDLPAGKVVGEWKAGGGRYCGYVYVIPREDALDILEGRDANSNPDANGDLVEVIAWIDCGYLSKDNPALRKELRDSMDKVAEAFPKSHSRGYSPLAAHAAVLIVDTVTGGRYTPAQRAVRAEFVRAARRKGSGWKDPMPGVKNVTPDGVGFWHDATGRPLGLGEPIRAGSVKLTQLQRRVVAGLSQEDRGRYFAARREGSHAAAMKTLRPAPVKAAKKTTPAKAAPRKSTPAAITDVRGNSFEVRQDPDGRWFYREIQPDGTVLDHRGVNGWDTSVEARERLDGLLAARQRLADANSRRAGREAEQSVPVKAAKKAAAKATPPAARSVRADEIKPGDQIFVRERRSDGEIIPAATGGRLVTVKSARRDPDSGTFAFEIHAVDDAGNDVLIVSTAKETLGAPGHLAIHDPIRVVRLAAPAKKAAAPVKAAKKATNRAATSSAPAARRAALRADEAAGRLPEVEPFYGNASPFSQHHPAPFTIDGVTYPTTEHFMMAEKARMFGDEDALLRILATSDPVEAKRIGRQVRNFDAPRWDAAAYDIVVRANLAKFSQNRALRERLLATGDRVLVEASPRDTRWGIGRGSSDPDKLRPSQWRGQNQLGFALMDVRDELRGAGAARVAKKAAKKAPAKAAKKATPARKTVPTLAKQASGRPAEEWGGSAPRVTPSAADIRTGWLGGPGGEGGHAPGTGRIGKTEAGPGWTQDRYEAAVRATIDAPEFAASFVRTDGREVSVRVREVDGVLWAVYSDNREPGGSHVFHHAYPVNGAGVIVNTSSGAVAVPLDRTALTADYWSDRIRGTLLS